MGGGTNLVGNGLNTVPSSATSSTGSAGAHTHTISVSAADAGGDEAHLNVQPTIIPTKIIDAGSSYCPTFFPAICPASLMARSIPIRHWSSMTVQPCSIVLRSEVHTSELQSLQLLPYVVCGLE